MLTKSLAYRDQARKNESVKKDKNYPIRFISIIFIVHLILWGNVFACSTFFLFQDGVAIFGKNYDWDLDLGLVIVNKRGLVKEAINYQEPVKWKAKYGSVTFTQYGKEFPHGGMNEAGLVIEDMWLSESEYPIPDERPEIDNSQWIQYQLDNCRTVDEVLASDSLVRVAPLSQAAIHYLVSDREGGCATIEFLNGQIIYHQGKHLPATALANSTYQESLEYLKQHRGFGGKKKIANNGSSLDRFVRMAQMIKEYDRKKDRDIISYGFSILENVAAGDFTKWRIIYDMQKRHIYFRTWRRNKVKIIDLNSLDFSCTTPLSGISINTKRSGNLNRYMNKMTLSMNRDLIKRSFSQTDFLANIPEELLERVLQYSQSYNCE